jgi:hypothetical protein
MNFKKHVKLGLNHHLLYSDVASIPSEHERTLNQVLGDKRLEILDLWIAEENPYRANEIKAIKDSGKEIYYNVGTRKGKPGAHPASLDPEKKKYSIDFYKSELDRAIECGATKVITNSGPNNPENRDAAKSALVEFYVEICKYVPNMLVMIEPTDWDFDKRKLIGSSAEAVEICKRVKQAGCDNIASMVDMCHVPMMYETLEQAMNNTGQWLGHIHLGNCIIKDKNNPLFGDKHPALCIEGGEFCFKEMAELFKTGVLMGYFSEKKRGSASIEMRALKNIGPEKSLDLYYDYVIKSWDLVNQK